MPPNPNYLIKRTPLEPLSQLAPYSALIISIIFAVYFLIRFYLLEGFLLRRLYNSTYTRLSETNRRGFVNHHIAGGTKLLILLAAGYPFFDVAFHNGTYHRVIAGSQIITQGDILVVAAQMLIAMYVFELFYRAKISPVSVGHHIGAVLIGQIAIAISLGKANEELGPKEFGLCLVWGKRRLRDTYSLVSLLRGSCR